MKNVRCIRAAEMQHKYNNILAPQCWIMEYLGTFKYKGIQAFAAWINPLSKCYEQAKCLRKKGTVFKMLSPHWNTCSGF